MRDKQENTSKGLKSQLTPSQYRLLCFCAYLGEYPQNNWLIGKYDALFGLRKGRTASDHDELQRLGYISSGKISTGRYFPAIIPMMQNHPEWIPQFEELGHFRNDAASYLWNVSKCIAAGDLTKAKIYRYPSTGNVWQYFSPLFYSAEYSRFISVLAEEDICQLLHQCLYLSMFAGTVDEALLSKACDSARFCLRHPEDVEGVTDHAYAYRYFTTGELPPLKGAGAPQTRWSLAVQAIAALYRDEPAEALDLFLSALNISGRFDSANVFRSPVLTWFYTVCIARCRRELRSLKAERAFEHLSADSKFKFDECHTPARTFLYNFDSSDSRCLENVYYAIRTFQQNRNNDFINVFGRIVCLYFRLSAEKMKALGYDDSPLPQLAILRSEMSPFIPMTSEERERLHQMFGNPSLAAVPHKESWEILLSEVRGKAEKNSENDLPDRRIIYFFDSGWISAIIGQSRVSADEEWGNEKILSRSVFCSDGYDCMNAADHRIASVLNRIDSRQQDLDVVIPFMIDSDRVFTGQHYRKPFRHLEIKEEQPVISFRSADGMIRVSSNVGAGADSKPLATTIRTEGERYVCILTNPVQRDIIGNLLRAGDFPVSAAPAIKTTISSLKGLLEVQSEIEDMASFETIEGCARLALRFTPDNKEKDYILTILTAPNIDGNLRCSPGLGAEEVYDDTGEKPVFVKRNLQREFDCFAALKAKAVSEWGLEFFSAAQCRVSSSQSLLNILVWAHDNGETAFVEWPEGRALRFRGEISRSNIDISVKSGIDWFSIEGGISIGKDRYNLREVLDALNNAEVKGYVKLGDRDYIRMSETIIKHLESLDEMMNTTRGAERVVPIYRVGQLASVLGEDGGLCGTMDKGFTDLLTRMQDAYDSTPELPAGLNATLRDYQKEGYVWMKRLDAWGAGSCLADDMGLGKTLQSIAFILSKADEGPSLVIAPKSVLPNWEIELGKFAPSLKVRVLNSEKSRKKCIEEAEAGFVVLATYGVLASDSALLASREWNVVCLDEAHQIKNRNTKASNAAMKLRPKSRIILTGTPIQNNLGELWNLFQFINPGMLGQWKDFVGRYMDESPMSLENRSFLKDLVQPFILRRTKEEVLSELPEKIVYEQMIELSEEEMQMYEAMRKYVEDHIISANGRIRKGPVEKIRIDFFAELSRLRMAACSMSLVHDEWQWPSSKTEALKSILGQLTGIGSNRILIFSQFTSYLDQVRQMLEKEGIGYLYLDGQTSLRQRAGLVSQFQDGRCPVFLISLKAGGLGLNLTAANYVIMLDPWWNPSIERQAMDRAHRLGQKRNVTVIRLISKGTIEEKILRLHEAKQILTDEMLDGTDASGRLTMDQILDMVSPFR